MPLPPRIATAALVAAFGTSLAAGCSADRGAPVTEPLATSARSVSPLSLPALVEDPIELTVPTYDGSGQSVHPDVVEFPQDWNGSRYWLSMTPYPKSDYKIENPSILVSQNGTSLAAPTGLVNPVVGKRGKPSDYNSDPELVYEPQTNRLVMFYRFVDRKTNTILVTSTSDGRTWRSEGKAFWTRGHAAVSPSVVARDPAMPATPTRMWYVDASKGGCKAPVSRVMTRTAFDTTGRVTGVRWSEPASTDLAQPGYVIWHLKVRYVPSKGQYWALYAAYPAGQSGGCDVDDLFFARSNDGVHWETFPEPLLRHEDRAWTGAAMYRSTFLFDSTANQLRVWFSARGTDQRWRMGFARFRYDRMLDEIGPDSERAPRNAMLARQAIGRSENEP